MNDLKPLSYIYFEDFSFIQRNNVIYQKVPAGALMMHGCVPNNSALLRDHGLVTILELHHIRAVPTIVVGQILDARNEPPEFLHFANDKKELLQNIKEFLSANPDYKKTPLAMPYRRPPKCTIQAITLR